MYSRINFTTITNVNNKLPKAIDPKLLIDLHTLLMMGEDDSPDSKYQIATVELVQ